MPLSEHVYCAAIAFKTTQHVEQRICIKFCVKLEHSFVETIWVIQKALRDYAIMQHKYVWHKCFKDGRESAESGPRSGRPAISRIPEDVGHVWPAINKVQ